MYVLREHSTLVFCSSCQVNDAFDTALSVPLGRRRPLVFVLFGRKSEKVTLQEFRVTLDLLQQNPCYLEVIHVPRGSLSLFDWDCKLCRANKVTLGRAEIGDAEMMHQTRTDALQEQSNAKTTLFCASANIVIY